MIFLQRRADGGAQGERDWGIRPQARSDILQNMGGKKICIWRVLPKINVPKKINLPKINFPVNAKSLRDLSNGKLNY